MSTHHFSRRDFLMAAGAVIPALRLETILRNPYAPTPRLHETAGASLRIRGRVRVRGRGLAGVAVTDGLEIVTTGRDGSYELLTSAGREHVYISIPAGHRIPKNTTGTARFYQPIPPNAGTEMAATFDLEPLEHADQRHTLLLLPDPQTQDAQEMKWFHEQTVPDVRKTVASLGDREVFGVSCGDIMFDNLELFPDYERAVTTMGIPFFQVVGNHDLDQKNPTDERSTETFCGRFGPRYCSFDRGAVHYVVLDDVFWHGTSYIGYLGSDQLTWLERDLARIERGRTVIVLLHIPVIGSQHLRRDQRSPQVGMAIMNREAFYKLLSPYKAHVVAGHTHENEHVFEHGVHEHVSGTVCGGWWTGPICGDGTPSGYSVYDVDGESVSWRYQATGKDPGHQIRVYRRGADPRAADEIVANVWDWDPEWRVVWYEGGERRGLMSRRRGLDPLSVELHAGPSLPPRRTWVDPYVTDHLFYAPVSRDARDIKIEATDRFGRTHVGTLG